MANSSSILLACIILLTISIASFSILLLRLKKTREKELELLRENAQMKKTLEENETQNESSFGLVEIEMQARLNNIAVEQNYIELSKRQLQEKVVQLNEDSIKEKQKLDERSKLLLIEKANLEKEKKIFLERRKENLQISIKSMRENEMINALKEEIEEKEKIITDNINYAKRITAKMSGSENEIENYLPQSFILKDSMGDFSSNYYWCSAIVGANQSLTTNSKIIVAALDSKRHGIQSAFINIFVNTTLLEIVNEKGVTQPDLILNYLNEKIRDILLQSNSESEGGLEAAVCCIDTSTMQMQYAGALCPLYLFTSGEGTPGDSLSVTSQQKAGSGEMNISLTEPDVTTAHQPSFIIIDPDSFSLAGGNHPSGKINFTNRKINLKPGDTFYIFTDGYINLFKNDSENKFQNLLAGIQLSSMNEQRKKLKEEFERLKKQYDSADDALIIGVRI